jgi:Tol biopolymer transport system component
LGQRRTTAQDRRGVYELYVVDADGQNLRRLLPADKFSIIGWSSDGKSVFYTNGSGIFAVNLAGQSQRLTSTSVDIDNGNPVLSPDSLRVAFRGPGGELRVLGVSTGAEITVAVAPQGKGFDWIGWSPDGRTLGYLTGADQERGAELRIVPSSGGPAALLATMDIRFPRVEWAPNGREIGFERADKIAAVAIDSLAERRVASVGGWAFGGWSPDGASVAYWGEHRGGGAGDPLYVAAADGTNERLVGTSAYPFRHWAYWSADSAELAFDADFDGGTIHVVPASGAGAPRVVTGSSPRWSPTGARLAYVVPAPVDGHLGGAVSVIDRDGSDARVLARALVGPDRYPVETRTWKNGFVVAKFNATEAVEALALSGNRIALLTGTRARRRIEVRRTGGRRLRTTTVPRDVAPELSMAGRWVVFRTKRTIRVLDLRSGTTSVLAHTRAIIVGLSIEGRRVAWGEVTRGPDRIRAIVLPE